MVVVKNPLPDDPAPLDCPPSYGTPNTNLTHAHSHDERDLEPMNSSSPVSHARSPASLSPPSPTSSGKDPSSSNAKGKGKAKASSSWFGSRTSKTKREVKAKVLGSIRDLVKDQNQNKAACLAILESCAEACSGCDLTLSDILQVKSIEGHTPMHWAIMKRAPDDKEHGKTVPDLLKALMSYATPLNPHTIADMRHACLLSSDQPLFQRLRASPEFSQLSGTDEMLLGATIPPDAIEVKNSAYDEKAFNVNFEIAHFQKRMFTSKRVQLDFIAKARMWRLEFLIAESSWRRDGLRQGSWYISLSLLENSPPTWIFSNLLVPNPTSTSYHTISITLQSSQQLAVSPRTRLRYAKGFCYAIIQPLDDYEMNCIQFPGTSYIAADETLRARLEARLIQTTEETCHIG